MVPHSDYDDEKGVTRCTADSIRQRDRQTVLGPYSDVDDEGNVRRSTITGE